MGEAQREKRKTLWVCFRDRAPASGGCDCGSEYVGAHSCTKEQPPLARSGVEDAPAGAPIAFLLKRPASAFLCWPGQGCQVWPQQPHAFERPERVDKF